MHDKIGVGYPSQLAKRGPVFIEKKPKLNDAAIQCIIIDGRSWEDFRRSGMLKFLNTAVPSYSGATSRAVKRNLSKLQINKKEEFKKEIAEIPNVLITIHISKSKTRMRVFDGDSDGECDHEHSLNVALTLTLTPSPYQSTIDF